MRVVYLFTRYLVLHFNNVGQCGETQFHSDIGRYFIGDLRVTCSDFDLVDDAESGVH